MRKDIFPELKKQLMERLRMEQELGDEQVLEEIDLVIEEAGRIYFLPLTERERLRKELFFSLRRLDVLQELVEDPSVTEIMVNGYEKIFVERGGRVEKWEKKFTSREKLEDVIQQIVGRCNRTVNENDPIVDARLENGDRVNVVLPPVALDGAIPYDPPVSRTEDYDGSASGMGEHFPGGGRVSGASREGRIFDSDRRGNLYGKNYLSQCPV